MNFQKLLSIADDIPGCGTVPRPWPPHRPHWSDAIIRESANPGLSALHPQPDPWHAEIRSAVFSAIRMAQLAKQVGGAAGQSMMSVAAEYFDGYCGNVPFSVLIQNLLHPPPPQPEPWLERLVYLGNVVSLARVAGQEETAAITGRQLAEGFSAVVRSA